MGRKKGSVIGAEEDPKVDTAAPGVDGSLETPSGSFSTSSTHPTCPHCNSVFQDMSITDFRDHVASCTRPSTADDDDASSALTTPPASPSLLSQLLSSVADADEGPLDFGDVDDNVFFAEEEVRRPDPEVVAQAAHSQKAVGTPRSNSLEGPRPYTNWKTDFVYYDQNLQSEQPELTEQPEQTEPEEDSDADQDPQDVNPNVPDADESPEDATQDPQHAIEESDAGEDIPASQDLLTTQKSREATQDPQDINSVPDADQNPEDANLNASQAIETTDAGEDLPASQNLQHATEPNSDVVEKAPGNVGTRRFPFAKFTELESFDNFLANPEDMGYDELYRRTSAVTDTLVAYQNEWDSIDKEIYEYESNEKSEKKRLEEETRAKLEEDRLKDEAERDEVAEKFKVQLKLNGKKWQEFMAEKEYSMSDKTIRQLQNLRNPQFMAQARKKARAAATKAKKLLNTPWPEARKTKEDYEWERRQRGRYMDRIKFDDMKQADAYGFEYSSHNRHYGQQPTEVITRQRNSNPNPTSNPVGEDTNDANRRTQRNATRKKYGDDADATPEESAEEDGQKLQKRIRKPKIYVDGIETGERSRGLSRSGTPPVRTFASGKRVGRPPAKSKLQAVQLARPSTTPDGTSGNEGSSANVKHESEHQDLAPSQEAQLHDAAESLVNQTQAGKSSGTVTKRRLPGGRSKKNQKDAVIEAPEMLPPSLPQQRKRKHAGGRQMKDSVSDIPVDTEPEDVVQGAPKRLKLVPKKRGGRVKKEALPEDDLVQLGAENVLQSTEHDDESNYTSAVTSRPTTSDSNSTFGSRRSARPATREKTAAREARASVTHQTRRGSTAVPSTSLPTKTRVKRKRASSETDPSPIVVEPLELAASLKKKRKATGLKLGGLLEVPEMSLSPEPEAPAGRAKITKRKRANTLNESIAVAGSTNSAPIDLAPPTKKPRRKVKDEEELSQKVEDADADADIDEDLLDDEAKAARKKQLTKEAKSAKLSDKMKNRWADGKMKQAQETRKANNAIKREHKAQTARNAAAGLPPPPPPVLVGSQQARSGKASASASVSASAPAIEPAIEEAPEMGEEPEVENEIEPEAESPVEDPGLATASPIPAPATTIAKPKKAKSKVKAMPPTRPASTRTRMPTRKGFGFDGVNDDEDEYEEDAEQQFASEYDQFQALTSPRKPVLLGKRVRKSYVDLSQLMSSGEEEDFSG